mmetsp:Transcript_7339/g.14086  ORF Transcript_7339/g.14086 Transcript_7339/m.14086 type:complete len:315 (+) Transcript_7339:336-1280(+)
MIKIYGDGFPTEERKSYLKIIHANTIDAMQRICKASDNLGKLYREEGRKEYEGCEMVDKKAIKCKDFIMTLRPLDEPLTELICNNMKIVWRDPGIQATFKFRGSFDLPDSADYFFDRLDETWKEDYIPNLQDVLRSRVRTTGILEQRYVHNGSRFHLFDVGGQRNERKKWIHLFADVTAVIFVASLSAYDQVLYEDTKVNRMKESLNLFEEICNLRWFQKTSLLLFLNKSDLFEKKLPHVELNVCFPDYEGANEKKEAEDFIRDKFVSRNRNTNKQVYTHITNATDTGNVHVVFNTCQDIIIRISLKQAGLLMA